MGKIQPKLKQGNSRSVVKSNRLNSAIHNLSLDEFRLIQLAIIESRESGDGFTHEKPLRVSALHFSRAFNIDSSGGYRALRAASQSLVRRTFIFVDRKDGNPVESNWLQHVKYLNNEGAIELVFTGAVSKHIYDLDGRQTPFTQYALKQTAPLPNITAIRLYELILQWVTAGETHEIDLLTFRRQLEVADGLYSRVSNFRVRVLEPAMAHVKEHTDINAEYELTKQGRSIVGIRFFNIVRKGVVEEENEWVNETDVIATVEQGENLSLDLTAGAASAAVPIDEIVLTHAQADRFARRIVSDPACSGLIPQSCSNAREANSYISALLQKNPDFVKRVSKHLRRYGFKGSLPG